MYAELNDVVRFKIKDINDGPSSVAGYGTVREILLITSPIFGLIYGIGVLGHTGPVEVHRNTPGGFLGVNQFEITEILVSSRKEEA